MPVVLKMSDESPQRPRRRRLRYIAVLPTLVTLGNLVCGFAAIHFGLRAMYAAGAGVDSSLEQTLDSQMDERMLPSFLSICPELRIWSHQPWTPRTDWTGQNR